MSFRTEEPGDLLGQCMKRWTTKGQFGVVVDKVLAPYRLEGRQEVDHGDVTGCEVSDCSVESFGFRVVLIGGSAVDFDQAFYICGANEFAD